MDREGTLKFVNETSKKLTSFLNNGAQRSFEARAEEKIFDALIWIERYANSFHKPIELVVPDGGDKVDVNSIRNDSGKIAYKINYLDQLIEKLIKMGNGTYDVYSQTTLVQAINYLIEAKACYERVKV